MCVPGNVTIERFETYFARLEGFSTEELDASLEKLVRAEKRSVALVIAHIAEMSRRKTEDNVEQLLADCAGMNKRDVEEFLVTLRPKPVFKPSIRKAPPRAKASSPRASTPPSTQAASPRADQRPRPRAHDDSPNPRARTSRPVQLPLRGRPSVQGEVRATGRGPRCREPLQTHGRDSRASPRHRPRQEGPQEETRTPTSEEGETERWHRETGQVKISPGRDFCNRAFHRLPLPTVGSPRASPRPRRPPM